MIKKLQKKSDGFTLIELLVVVAIIAILALIVLLAINPVEMGRRSRDSRRLSDLGTVRRAIDLSLADGKTLNATTGYITISQTASSIDGLGLDISKYLSVGPKDPANDGTSANTQTVVTGSPCTPGSTAKNAMNYEYKSDGSVYVLRVRLESLDNCDAVKNDGNNSNYFEIGTDPGLDL